MNSSSSSLMGYCTLAIRFVWLKNYTNYYYINSFSFLWISFFSHTLSPFLLTKQVKGGSTFIFFLGFFLLSSQILASWDYWSQPTKWNNWKEKKKKKKLVLFSFCCKIWKSYEIKKKNSNWEFKKYSSWEWIKEE